MPAVRLTVQIVEQAQPPERGELWLADTVVLGFGLRIWRNKSGAVGKQFAVRTTTWEGKQVRRSLFKNGGAYTKLVQRSRPISQSLPIARERARIVLAELRGESRSSERRFQRKVARAGQMTLEQSKDHFIQKMRIQDRSQAYLDRLEKLWAQAVPSELAGTKLADIDVKAIFRAVQAANLGFGSVRTIRPFIRKALSHDGLLRTRYEWEKLNRTKGLAANLDEQAARLLSERPKGWIAEIIQTIKGLESHWQQRLCLSVYFETNLPLKEVMAGRWRNLRRIRDEFLIWEKEKLAKWRQILPSAAIPFLVVTSTRVV